MNPDAAAPGIFDTPQNILLLIGQAVTIIVAVLALIGTLGARKIRTPADELARAEFAYTKIKERLAEVDDDRKYLSDSNDALRDALRRADTDANASLEDKRKLRELIETGNEKIGRLETQNRVLHQRLEGIADKVRTGQPITLNDVYGSTNIVDITTGSLEVTDHLGLGDIEYDVHS